MRVIKEASVRRSEILDAAEKLFHEKGYAGTTTEDILRETGIARGTLYYHFKGKEEILCAVIDRNRDICAEKMSAVANDPALNVWQKLVGMIKVQLSEGTAAEGLHDIENAQFHQRSFTQGMLRFTPIYTQVIEEGIQEGVFDNPFPKESVELLICASIISDEGFFRWNQEEIPRKKEAFVTLFARTFGVTQTEELKNAADEIMGELYGDENQRG